MSFTSQESIVVPYSADACCDIINDTELFVEFMSLSDITGNVKITSTDEVLLTSDQQIIELDPAQSREDKFELCTRINFSLIENVTYLGIAKEISVVGYVVCSAIQKIQVEHREASDGLVVTDKVRRFIAHPVTESKDPECTDPAIVQEGTAESETTKQAGGSKEDESILADLVSDESEDAEPSEPHSTKHSTEIREEIAGVTSWYLKYFVELEARRSHKAIISKYSAYLGKTMEAHPDPVSTV